MRILHLNFRQCESGQDPIYDGLCRILGPENVIEYPKKPSLHGGPPAGYRWYPCYFNWPEFYSDKEKIQLLKNNWFDMILVACGSVKDWSTGSRFQERITKGREEFSEMYELAMEKSKTIPTYALDTGDESGLNTRIRKEFNCIKYFKREYLEDITGGDPTVIPLSLCLAENYVPEKIVGSRINLPFFAGKSYANRKDFIDYYESFGKPNTRNLSQRQLNAEMLKYRIGIDLPGFGEDTIRHYEVPARGEMLLCHRVKIKRENDFIDGKSAVFYEGFEDFKNKLNYYLKHESEADKIRMAGRKHFLKYHTGTARAKELIRKMKQTIKMDKLAIGILSWNSPKTLRNTLKSYQESGLLKLPGQVFIYFNGISVTDVEIAKEFGIPYFGSAKNLGIAGGYGEMLRLVEKPYFLFLENDWEILPGNYHSVALQLKDGIKLLSKNVEVVRLRSREHPGEPLWSRQFQGMEMSHPELLLDSVHWTKNPEVDFAPDITSPFPNWYVAGAKNANWTNNPHMVKTKWAKKVLTYHLKGDIELGVVAWWPQTKYKVAQGEGLFTHNRAVSLRGIEIFLHQKEQLSDHVRKTKDFFEANILDYIRDNYPQQKTIVDAGANIGNHVAYFTNFLKYDSIYAFEPIPENFKLLKINSSKSNINLFQNALSNKNEVLKMAPNSDNMGASRVSRYGKVVVNAVAIDSLKLKDVTLFKIDVEDSEEYVIAGAKKTIEKYHPLILLEDGRGKYGKILENEGYILEKAWPKQYTYLYRYPKPYLIAIYSPTPGCKNYERTFPKLAKSVERIDCRLNKYPGHLYRWDKMPENLDRNRVFIFTDSADVIFQKPFPILDPQKVYVGSEGETFNGNAIWRSLIRKHPEYTELLDKTNYNVGCFACGGNLMDKFIEFLKDQRKGSKQMLLEQIIFNLWLREPDIWPRVTEVPDLFCPVYANIKHGLASIKNRKIVNNKGGLFSAIHFNGNTKQIYHNILEDTDRQKHTRIFLDVGAYDGKTAREVLSSKHKFDKIYCFEPQPKLCKTIRAIGSDKIITQEFGLWNKTCRTTLFCPEKTNSATVYPDRFPPSEVKNIPVKMVKASDWFAKYIKPEDYVVMKMNCEGSECDILDDLFASGEYKKISALMVDFDVRKIPSQKHREEEIRKKLQVYKIPAIFILEGQDLYNFNYKRGQWTHYWMDKIL